MTHVSFYGRFLPRLTQHWLIMRSYGVILTHSLSQPVAMLPFPLMYISALVDAPVPQFGLLVTGTGKPPISGCSIVILTWSLGQLTSLVSYRR